MVLPLLLITGLAQPADSGLLLKAVRFYRADPGQSPGTTQVTAMLRIPAELAEPSPTGEVTLTFSVRVVGEAGVLYEQAWRKRTAVPFPRGEADRLDVLRFSLASGRYRLEARVVDSVSGRRLETVVPIEAYPEPPPVSDLLLSSGIRPAAAADTFPQAGEFRRGGLIVAIAPEVVVGGTAASLAYLVETYSGTSIDAALTVTITDAAGAIRRQTEPTPVRVSAGIGLLTGQIEVGDLSPGRFRLVATLALGGRTVRREAAFAVDPAAAAAPASLTDAAYFAGLAGTALDRAFAPLTSVAEPGELVAWSATGSDSEKRAFLAAFWGRRDPTPATGNERRARFYDGVTYANAFYGDPRRQLEGWQTDRGRVFLREGLPNQVVRRQPRGRIPAYEVWRYFERNRFYLFLDRGASGTSVLVRSNDPQETDEPRWQQLLTPQGVREVVGLLGRSVLEGR